MDLSILQLNFLYMYRYCQSLHIRVNDYDDVNIEDIEQDDIKNLLCYLLNKQSISVSMEDCIYTDKIESYLEKTETELMSILGPVLFNKIYDLRSFKDSTNRLIATPDNRFFIDKFDMLMEKTIIIRNTIQDMESAKPMKQSSIDNKEALSIIFGDLF